MNILNEFIQQSTIGIGICGIIAIAIIIHFNLSTKTARFYKKMLNDFISHKDEEEPAFENEYLVKIYNDFIISVKSGTQNINTQVIMEKNIPILQHRKEAFIEYLGSLAIILGLLGTFIGLTGSIGEIKEVLKGLNQMEQFIEAIKIPLANMATAFITSIAGIVASIVMNLISLVPNNSYKLNKSEFIDNLEDYLDNVLNVKYGINYNKMMVDFTEKVTESMKYMTDKVTDTFDKGVDKFAEKINYISVDLRESAVALGNVVGKLEDAVNMFSTPVLVFKESVDALKVNFKGLDIKILQIDNIVKNLIESFDMTIDSFNGNTEKLDQISEGLNYSMLGLTETYGKVKTVVDTIEVSTTRNDQLIRDLIKEIDHIYNQLINVIDGFKSEIGTMSIKVSESLKNEFDSEADKIAKHVNTQIATSLEDFEKKHISFDNTLRSFSERIGSLQKMIEETQDLSEVALTED